MNAHDFIVAGQIVEACAVFGLIVVAILLRGAQREETGRARRALQHVESDLKKTHAAAVARLEEDVEQARATADKAIERVRATELGLAKIEPTLEGLSTRMGRLEESVSRCATRDDIARLSGLMERMATSIGKLTGEVESMQRGER